MRKIEMAVLIAAIGSYFVVLLFAPVVAIAQPLSLGEFRTVDGYGNNLANPNWGRAGTELLRAMPCAYVDGQSIPPTEGLPGAREISNLVCDAPAIYPDPAGLSSMFWQWGQFLDHDIDLTPAQDPLEPFAIPVPSWDTHFDPMGTGEVSIPFARSKHSGGAGVREQMNDITAFIDASNIYGSTDARALELRMLDGSGLLKYSAGGYLPYNENGFDNAPTPSDPSFFLSGDVRVNEQLGLIALHTLFMREHNHWAIRFRAEYPERSGDDVYQMARAIVVAEMQVITYTEFLPLLLGTNALATYPGYDPTVHPGIENEFSTGAYRFGHTMLPSELMRLDASMRLVPEGAIPLKDAFFAPAMFTQSGTMEALLRGLSAQTARAVDPFLTSEIRNFLFGPPGSGGFDLAALNIQRGRDHGIPRYNQARRDLGLAERTSFAEITPDVELQTRLAAAYTSVEDIDFWVGSLAEIPLPGAVVGETNHIILMGQFERLRAGDRFWYENYLPQPWISKVKHTTLADVIRRNTEIDREIGNDVFVAPQLVAIGDGSRPVSTALQLRAPYPNPSRGAATVRLTVSHQQEISLAVYDLRGRMVRSLHAGSLAPGEHRFRWDRKDERGHLQPTGIYFIHASTSLESTSQKLVLID